MTPTGFDVVHSGTIAAGATDTYTYTAPAGLFVAIDNQTAPSQPIQIDLLDPSSQVVASVSNGNDTGGITLQVGGTYTVRVHGVNSSSTGSYQFAFDNFADATPLALGSNVSGTDTPYMSNLYQFNGSAGQRVFYNGLQSNSANVNFYLGGPFVSDLIAQNYNSQVGPITLPATGTYYMSMASDVGTSEAYSFRLFNSALPITPLTLGAPSPGRWPTRATRRNTASPARPASGCSITRPRPPPTG